MTELLVASQLAQPPTFDLRFFAADRPTGWVSPHALGFLGFESETEAMHAAYLAHRTLSRRLARRDGRRPIPVGTEPLTLYPDGSIHAAGRHIGDVVRPGPDSRSGPERFGFELPFPSPMEEATARSKCAHVYHVLRRSGIRWAMWRPARPARPAMAGPSAPRESVDQRLAASRIGWLGTLGLSMVMLVVGALTSSEPIGAALAGVGVAGLMIVRLYTMSPRWSLETARGENVRGERQATRAPAARRRRTPSSH